MKRFVALCLCVLTVALCLTSCGFDPDDKGAIMSIYIAEPVANLDPSELIYDKDVVKFSTLLFEGLTVINENGSVSPGLAKEWTSKIDEERDEYLLTFKLNESHWSDGRVLLADHFVYAWQRLLSPDSDSPAACLLFDVKNARKVKSGEMTVDDLGVAAVDNYTLEVQLEQNVDPELFLEAVASPALVPMRDDVIDDAPGTWATSTENFISCGYFNLSEMTDEAMSFTKASNYLISTDVNVSENPNKYVKPAELNEDLTVNDVDRWNALVRNNLHYLSVDSIPEGAESYASKVKSDDLLCTTVCYFNTTNELLKDANVRRALSLSIDRERAAELAGYAATPATGLIPDGVFDTANDSSFRKVGGDLIASAKSEYDPAALLKGKNLSAALSITYRKDHDADLAEYLQDLWADLGFNVKLNGVNDTVYKNVLKAQKFEILLSDYQALSTSAYSMLMPFATSYSGNVIDVDGGFTSPHMTGFSDADYDALADQIQAATTRKARVELLHQMEQLLLDQMPVAPICFWKNYYITSSESSGYTFNGFGVCTFKNATVSNYMQKNALLTAEAEEA